MLVMAATVDIGVLEPSGHNEKVHPDELGIAAAAIRPTLIELAKERSPPRVDRADVKSLAEEEELEPLAE